MNPKRGEVLVAIVKDRHDFSLVHDQHWYRIPVGSVESILKDRWPPRWVAFYMPKAFGEPLAYSVRDYAQVLRIERARRSELFLGEPPSEKTDRLYYKLYLGPLKQLPQPILSRRARRITFIPTTWEKFEAAAEINDLWDESRLEDHLWAEFKRVRINAERQYWEPVGKRRYCLDFAIFCADGKIDVETDGDVWHANPERAPLDSLRDNALSTIGWKVIRFTERHIKEELETYCLPVVTENINRMGGLNGERQVGRKVDPDDAPYQPSLFDDL